MAVSTPKTTRNLVIYQIFTRNYKEGTFKAVEADLERIKALGVDYVYLLPVQPSGKVNRKGSMGSPYAISDYRAVDPVQGTMEDFAHLCKEVHKAGMKIMIDVVYNHTSPDSWLAENHPEWFYHKADGSFGNRVGEWWDVIDLDYANPELWDYQIDTLKMWAEHVDGFRCDVAPLVPLDFWKRARAEVAEIRPDCLWLAESVEPPFIRYCRSHDMHMASDGELYQAFDILYDYDAYFAQVGAMLGDGRLDTYLDYVTLQESLYPENFSKLRCLENHDRNRAAFMLPDPLVRKNWTAWIYFATGTTMIYAGQEYACDHHPTLFDRDTVNFKTGTDDSAFLRKLAGMKKDTIFADSAFEAKATGRDGDIILATREKGDRKCIGIFSTTGHKQTVRVDLPDGTYCNVLNGKAVDVFEKLLCFDGEPMVLYTL